MLSGLPCNLAFAQVVLVRSKPRQRKALQRNGGDDADAAVKASSSGVIQKWNA